MKKYVFKVKSVRRKDRELGKTKMFKRCSKCGELKFIGIFSRDRHKSSGRVAACNECKNKYRKKYYKMNPNKLKDYKERTKECRQEYSKEYAIKNKNKIANYHKEHYRKNKDKIANYHKKYYKENKHEISEKAKVYYKENKHKILTSQKNYRDNYKEKVNERARFYYGVVTEKSIEEIKINFTRNKYKTNRTQYGVIYKVTCVNGRTYIGQTVNSFDVRYKSGFFYDKQYEFRNSESKQALMLLEDYVLYGEEGFTIDKCIDVAFSPEELDKLEVYYIDKYKAYDEGYNSNRGYINGRTTLYKKWKNENK